MAFENMNEDEFEDSIDKMIEYIESKNPDLQWMYIYSMEEKEILLYLALKKYRKDW